MPKCLFGGPHAEVSAWGAGVEVGDQNCVGVLGCVRADARAATKDRRWRASGTTCDARVALILRAGAAGGRVFGLRFSVFGRSPVLRQASLCPRGGHGFQATDKPALGQTPPGGRLGRRGREHNAGSHDLVPSTRELRGLPSRAPPADSALPEAGVLLLCPAPVQKAAVLRLRSGARVALAAAAGRLREAGVYDLDSAI